jgi:hypothetical protein
VTKAEALDEHLGGVDPWECVDELRGKSFAINAQARPCRVELSQVVALVQLACEFEVVEDTKDSLNDPHSRWHPQAMLSNAVRKGTANLTVVGRSCQ